MMRRPGFECLPFAEEPPEGVVERIHWRESTANRERAGDPRRAGGQAPRATARGGAAVRRCTRTLGATGSNPYEVSWCDPYRGEAQCEATAAILGAATAVSRPDPGRC
jgi:hypothetical protein